MRTSNEELIKFAKDQCEIFPEDSYMGKYLRETIKMLEDKTTLLDKVKQAREKIKRAIGFPICGEYIRRGHDMGLREALGIIDKLISEVE